MYPWGVAVSQDGKKVYVTNVYSNTVSIIDTATNKVTATVPVGTWPWGVAVTGTKVYVTNIFSDTVSVIDNVTNNVTATVPVGTWPWGVTVAGTKVYVAYRVSNNVSVINTATNNVTAAGNISIAFGQSIVSPPALQPVIPIANLNSNSTCVCS
jgi:YVTN family beta-propeller protein